MTKDEALFLLDLWPSLEDREKDVAFRSLVAEITGLQLSLQAAEIRIETLMLVAGREKAS